MTGALACWLGTLPLVDWPKRREGRLLKFMPTGMTMSRQRYNVYAVRGGFHVGCIEYRNQWGAFSFMADEGVPINREILGEIYAMLKELDSKG